MRTVYCPFCDNLQEQVGFRPMTFNCLVCGSEAHWYNGKEVLGIDRGFIFWLITDSTVIYWDGRSRPYISSCSKAEKLVLTTFKAAVNTFGDLADRIQERLDQAMMNPVENVMAIIELKMLQALQSSVGKAMMKTGAEYLGKVTLRKQLVEGLPMLMLAETQVNAQTELSGESAGDVEAHNAEDMERILKIHTDQCVEDAAVGVSALAAFISIAVGIRVAVEAIVIVDLTAP